MKLSQLIEPSMIRCHLVVETSEAALEEAARIIEENEPTIRVGEIMEALAERARRGPFSMIKSVALPHARIDKVKELKISMATLKNEVIFKHQEEQRKVNIIVLFVIPHKHSDLYLHTLAAFLNFFSLNDNINRLLTKEDPEQIIDVLNVYSPSFKGYTVAKDIVATELISVTTNFTLREILQLLKTSNGQAIPVTDQDGNLIGEIKTSSLLRLGIRDYLLFLSNHVLLNSIELFEDFRQNYINQPIQEIEAIIQPARSVEENTPLVDLIPHLLESETNYVYVTRGQKLIGVLTASNFIKNLAGIRW